MKKLIGFFANENSAINKIRTLNSNRIQGDFSDYDYEFKENVGFVVFGIIKFSESLQNEIDTLFN